MAHKIILTTRSSGTSLASPNPPLSSNVRRLREPILLDSIINSIIEFLGNLVSQILYRLVIGTILFYTGLVFLNIVTLGNVPWQRRLFQRNGNISAIGAIIWFTFAIGIGLYNDYQRSLW